MQLFLFSVLNPNFHLTGKPAQYVTMTRDDIRQLPAFQECECVGGSFGLTIDRMRDIGWRIYELATEDKTINDALNRQVKLMRIIVSEDHKTTGTNINLAIPRSRTLTSL